MSFITIKSSRIESELLILKSRLESEGINCFLKNEFTTQLMNYIPTFEIELQVATSDLESAKKIMVEVESN
ncbi:DUF2007 domain-containing protein [Seonamhaeicola sp. MEBiC1930]|uniref:putative signal transducing protein n=1 Tax=Seonamhaeicola sp. MEBiC01930 TaxID=2976768 RepID=UPI00324FE9D5